MSGDDCATWATVEGAAGAVELVCACAVEAAGPSPAVGEGAVDAAGGEGAVGAVAGTYGGWFIRTRTVAALHCPDFPIALVEDAIAVGGSILVCSLIAR